MIVAIDWRNSGRRWRPAGERIWTLVYCPETGIFLNQSAVAVGVAAADFQWGQGAMCLIAEPDGIAHTDKAAVLDFDKFVFALGIEAHREPEFDASVLVQVPAGRAGQIEWARASRE